MFGVRRAASAFGAVAFGLLLTISLATPAQAHISKAWHEQDFAVVTHTHNHITWCDQEADGHRTIAYYVTRNNRAHWTEWDGGDPGCGEKDTQSEIVWFAVCEEGEGCGRSVPA